MSEDRENGQQTEGAQVLRPDFGRPRASASTQDAAASDQASGDSPSIDEELADLDPSARAKLEVFSDYIERGMVMVTVDARPVGVRVPNHLKGELQLNLNFSHKFFIDDFAYDGRGIRASLTFRGQPYFCDLPWASVWMMRSMVDGAVVVSPEDVPEEVRGALATLERELEGQSEGDDIDAIAEEATASNTSSDDDPTAKVRQRAVDDADDAEGARIEQDSASDVSSGEPEESVNAPVVPGEGRPALRLIKD